MSWMRVTSTWIACLPCLCFCIAELEAQPGSDGAGRGLSNPFFAMETGTRDARHETADAQVSMLKELGYAGTDHLGLAGIPAKLKALDAAGLKFFAVYTGVTIDGGESRYNPALKSVLKDLEGRDTVVWLHVLAKGFKPSSPEGDARAVEVIREIADLAAASGLRVALYPHTGFWVERVEDAVRVAKKVERKNVGVTFNLCHSLKTDGEAGWRSRLEAALPHLFLVTVNGADSGGSDWKTLIQTLDRGSFDVRGFLSVLKGLGYSGPVGLQGYGIGGDVHDNLKRSLGAWRRISDEIAAGWIELLPAAGKDLSAWREPLGEWTVAGRVFKDPADERRLAWEPGVGAAVNGAKGRIANLLTTIEHGDVEAHIEFLVPRGSNSGVYFQGRYEIQVLDSWGVAKPGHGDCGGIYERWASDKGFEGWPPRVNASRAPGEWQSFDVIFRAPRWDPSGKKVANAVFVKVTHNGIVIHENQEVTGPTRASAFEDEKPSGPMMLQGDHGPVAYRNIRIRRIEGEVGAGKL